MARNIPDLPPSNTELAGPRRGPRISIDDDDASTPTPVVNQVPDSPSQEPVRQPPQMDAEAQSQPHPDPTAHTGVLQPQRATEAVSAVATVHEGSPVRLAMGVPRARQRLLTTAELRIQRREIDPIALQLAKLYKEAGVLEDLLGRKIREVQEAGVEPDLVREWVVSDGIPEEMIN